MTTGASKTISTGGFCAMLDLLCPMHLVLDRTGHIRHAGPTAQKLAPGRRLNGMRLMEVLELRRPRNATNMAGLKALAGRKLHLAMRCQRRTELKGVLVPLPDDVVPGVRDGAVLNLSFGISVVESVRDYGLSGGDFAETDQTIEMLYLVEAQTAVMQEFKRLNSRLNGARVEAEQQAFTDKLTGLGNRRAMDRALARLVEMQQRFTLMHIDLDHFKHVNDTYGHAAGDTVLQAVSQRLQQSTREQDVVIRQGGDEFLLVLPELVNPVVLEQLACRIVPELEKPVYFGENKLQVSASIGASISPADGGADIGQMMAEADTALYVVKENGRHGYRLYTTEMGRIGGDDLETDGQSGQPNL